MTQLVEGGNVMSLEERQKATSGSLKVGEGPQVHDGLPVNLEHLLSESTGPESPGYLNGVPEGDESLNIIISDD